MADETPDIGNTDITTEAETPAPTADATPEAVQAATAEPVVPLTPKERKVAARARRGKRRGATPEERAEERKAKAAARSRYRIKRRAKDRAARGEAGPAKTVSPTHDSTGFPKERLGIVVSDKADKTITVRIDVARRHRRYQKIVRSSTTLHAHDETNDANAGDRVRIIESRPLSATKRWRLVEILERAK
jgi:small subunit ribosomal protein S17